MYAGTARHHKLRTRIVSTVRSSDKSKEGSTRYKGRGEEFNIPVYLVATTRTKSLNRGSADFPTCCRIGKPKSQKVQHSRLGVSRGSADLPLPWKTEAVSAPRKTHTTMQTSLSRGPVNPTFTRIEAGSFTQKAQIRRAVHPFSTAESPQQYRRCRCVPPTGMGRHHTHR